ncbi:MAG: hypothetical protein JWO53_205 [Chlamydiia bacterium]|nr:hypothetical protein [Chlamydiia bacterium]
MNYARSLLLLWVIFLVPQLIASQTLELQILEYFCPQRFGDLPISNWNDPTLVDFNIIENYLRERQERIGSNLKAHQYILPSQLDGWISYRIGRTKLIDDTTPKLVKVNFGNNPDERECCIISYAGCSHGGRNYENALIVMVKALEKLQFKGHLIYRVGGWPSISKGRLRYADVPYAFKPFMFEEAKDMGYKHILWLDSCCIPIKDLSHIFSQLKRKGYCYYHEGLETHKSLESWDYIRKSLDAPKQEKYINVITQIVGISCVHPSGVTLLDEWIIAACKKLPFLNPTADQLCFSFLINKYNLMKGQLPKSVKCESASPTFELPKEAKKAYFYHNYNFVDSEKPPSESFFINLQH